MLRCCIKVDNAPKAPLPTLPTCALAQPAAWQHIRGSTLGSVHQGFNASLGYGGSRDAQQAAETPDDPVNAGGWLLTWRLLPVNTTMRGAIVSRRHEVPRDWQLLVLVQHRKQCHRAAMHPAGW